MITVLSRPTDFVFEIRITGTVTDEHYKDILIPALEKALEVQDRVRMLAIFDRDFNRYTLEALALDARMGLKHWRGFDRVAIVADTGWLKTSIKAFSVFMPCPVATFDLADIDTARRWLVEALGSINQTDLGDGMLHVQLRGQVDAAAYAEESTEMSAFLQDHDRFRLLLDLRDFDGWQGLDALSDHFFLVRSHHQKLDKIAIVGDAAWQAMASRLGRQLFKIPSHYFPSQDFDGAMAWLSSPMATETAEPTVSAD